jgi:presenilin-like A22 family membrane protease
MHDVLTLAGGAGLVTATAALCLLGRQVNRRFFAGLISIAVTLSLFSVLAWAATVIARVAPLPLIWALICTLALIFALRLYRELQPPPPSEQG